MYGVKDCKILKSLKNIQNFTKKNTTYQLLLSAISCKDIFCYGEYLCKILSHNYLHNVMRHFMQKWTTKYLKQTLDIPFTFAWDLKYYLLYIPKNAK